MKTLQQQLGKLFSQPAKRKAVDSDYSKFRKVCKTLGLTYKIAGDGYIELSNGRSFAHYTWDESLYVLQHPEADNI
jgi:hypothetical protein